MHEDVMWLGWYLLPGILLGFLVLRGEESEGRIPADLPRWILMLAALLIAPFWPVIVIEWIAAGFRAAWHRVRQRYEFWRARRQLRSLRRMIQRLGGNPDA